jgi:hypothetical protein
LFGLSILPLSMIFSFGFSNCLDNMVFLSFILVIRTSR